MNKVSFCMVCMNRLENLRKTIKKNIEDNINYPNVEFILLDYNSKDGLENWVKQNLNNYLDSGILKYYKTIKPKYFHRSHSRNVAFKLATGDILCNLDADNFLGKEFAHYINYHFSFRDDIFLISGKKDGSYGRVCVKRRDFFSIRGYDERMSGWGFEDDDLYHRLEMLGLQKIKIFKSKFLNSIEHESNASFSNDKEVLSVKHILIHHINRLESHVIYLFDTGKYNMGRVFRKNEFELDEIHLDEAWEEGTFVKKNNFLLLKSDTTNLKLLVIDEFKSFKNSEGKIYKKIFEKELLDFLLIQLTSLKNKNIFQSTIKNAKVQANTENNWGLSKLIKS
ncbi:glycosyltransferase family 2 protein [Tenacibaculum tangerinum]|uniref:Glycosyltransferase family 2 protein n=1 Tax=Tenacibaculum tangerinum TaxID=3038772 RepID=A0ABY8L5C4_9FLAO|nr:glycosyltransferase family 2 protein [Tenacibaculum tangerinum]WGH75239.1 glycosyltransferase family 2 protein [Tenacibaculum tangerinum]